MARLVTALLRVLLLSLPAAWASAGEPSLPTRKIGSWCVCETDYFAVWGSPGTGSVVNTAMRCESLRASLQDLWYEDAAAEKWRSKCVVVLHAHAEDYASAVALPGTRSVGCTTLQVDRGCVTFRRIDLRCDRSNWRSSALPHELTHVVLADRVAGRPLPLWADEGLAVLSESLSTRKAREDILIAAIRRGRTFPIGELLGREGLPVPERRDVFYSQSSALVALLVERAKPAGFIAYLERSRAVGDDAALRECCGIEGMEGLEELWRARANAALAGVLNEKPDKTAIAARVTGKSDN